MITAKSKSGFSIEIEETSLDNQELVDAFADLSDGNALAISKIIPMLLGKDGKKRLYEHLRTPEGRVPSSAVETEIVELMQSINDGKNSSSSPD